MTKEEIEKQIESIRKVTKEVCESKEKAIEFLKNAGIIKDEGFKGDYTLPSYPIEMFEKVDKISE